MQDCSNSIVNALELLQSCAKPLVSSIQVSMGRLLWALQKKWAQIAKFMGLTWGPPGSCGPQMGPMNRAIRGPLKNHILMTKVRKFTKVLWVTKFLFEAIFVDTVLYLIHQAIWAVWQDSRCWHAIFNYSFWRHINASLAFSQQHPNRIGLQGKYMLLY